MKVREVIEALQKCDPEMEVISHANNHTAIHGGVCNLRVVLMDTYAGPRVCIGNLSRKRVNYPNEFVTHELDGKEPLPEDWETFPPVKPWPSR